MGGNIRGDSTLGKGSRFYVLPVVALTAHAMQSDKQRCLDAGMNAHIAKPVDFDKLKEILQNL